MTVIEAISLVESEFGTGYSPASLFVALGKRAQQAPDQWNGPSQEAVRVLALYLLGSEQ